MYPREIYDRGKKGTYVIDYTRRIEKVVSFKNMLWNLTEISL